MFTLINYKSLKQVQHLANEHIVALPLLLKPSPEFLNSLTFIKKFCPLPK